MNRQQTRRSWLNPFGETRWTMRTSLVADECAARLRQGAPRWCLPFPTPPRRSPPRAIGRVGTGGFAVKRCAEGRNSFSTVACGHFRGLPEGTLVEVRFGVPPWVKVWFVLLAACVLPVGYIVAAGALLVPESVEGSGRHFLGVLVALLVTGGIVGLPLFAR